MYNIYNFTKYTPKDHQATPHVLTCRLLKKIMIMGWDKYLSEFRYTMGPLGSIEFLPDSNSSIHLLLLVRQYHNVTRTREI